MRQSRFSTGHSAFWIGLAALVIASGCDDSTAPKKVTVYPVKGAVLLANGKALGDGHIYFVPKDGALTSEAKIQPDGSFSLVTGVSGEGAPPGEFKIRIEPSVTSVVGERKSSGKTLPFPARYLDEDSSGLTASVKAEPTSLEPFRLK